MSMGNSIVSSSQVAVLVELRAKSRSFLANFGNITAGLYRLSSGVELFPDVEDMERLCGDEGLEAKLGYYPPASETARQ